MPTALRRCLAVILLTLSIRRVPLECPKGVVVTHEGLNNYLQWSARNYNASQGSGAPAHSSIGFDLTITSIYPQLLMGRPVIFAPGQHDVENLAEILQSSKDLTLVKLTPAHMEMLNNSLTAEQMKQSARSLVIGGEALNYESLTLWRINAPETTLINEYGPTEATVGCCIYQVGADDPFTGTVPIGAPIANTQLYVLDTFAATCASWRYWRTLHSRHKFGARIFAETRVNGGTFCCKSIWRARRKNVPHGRPCAQARRRPVGICGACRSPGENSRLSN